MRRRRMPTDRYIYSLAGTRRSGYIYLRQAVSELRS